jgi:hypothetical protein
MKKILLSLMLIAAFASLNTAKAQCDLEISNVSVSKDPDFTPQELNGPPRCQVKFNVSFDIKTNSGFKYLFFHSWLDADYPNPALFNCTGTTPADDPGTAAQLGTTIYEAGKSILDFGFIGLKDSTLPSGVRKEVTTSIATGAQYPNNNGGGIVALNTADSAFITRGTGANSNILHFEIYGVVVEILGDCGQPITVSTDVWGANVAGNKQYSTTPPIHDGTQSNISAQCYICGSKQSFNDPALALTNLCGKPRQFSFSITTALAPVGTYTYKVYYHNVLAPNQDYLVLTDNVTLSAQGGDAYPSFYFSGTMTVDPTEYPDFYEADDPAANYGSMRLDVTSDLFSNTVSTGNLAQECATLPVSLKSFTATRKNSSTVAIKWETAQEENNKGFDVQRKLANGGWQTVAFVETKATRGNSGLPLSYEFTDLNDAKGISQYRLRQVDLDGKQTYSQIRAVRGEGQKGKTIIYPNPSGDGKVNIVFENVNSTRDVSLMDVSGKTLKQWKGVTNNNIQIDNLNAGFYSVRIVNNETGEQTVEKFIVNKR